MRTARTAGLEATWLAWLLLAAAGVVQGAGAVAGNEVRGLLEKMVQAVHSLDYDGTFVYLHGDQLESMRVVHTVGAEGEREQLISLNGAAREVVRDEASITCIAPDAREISIGDRSAGGFRAVFSIDVDRLGSLYDFHLLGQSRVAGRWARVVAIIPRDAYRYGYRLFIDDEHALPLKTDMLDAEGDMVSQIMFTTLHVDPEVKPATEGGLEGLEDFAWRLRKPKVRLSDNEKINWKFKNLPSGFEVNATSRRRAAGGEGEMDHFVLSDGLATVSVYVEARPSAEGLRGLSAMGAVNAYGSEVAGHEVTVVGQVPPKTVRAVADALSYVNGGTR